MVSPPRVSDEEEEDDDDDDRVSDQMSVSCSFVLAISGRYSSLRASEKENRVGSD